MFCGGVGAALTSACDDSGVSAGAGGALLACDVEVGLVGAGADRLGTTGSRCT